MTIGERIKFFRTQRGITSTQLAELSGIHPVSIRKYETNKMIPQEEQIRKIADALSVSYYALAGTEGVKFPETKGDLVGLIIMLYKTGIIEFTGERDKHNRLSPKNAKIKFNSDIASQFLAFLGEDSVDIDNITLKIKDSIDWENLIFWVSLYESYNEAFEKKKDNMSDSVAEAFEKKARSLERAELLTQTSKVLLNDSNTQVGRLIIGPRWQRSRNEENN